MSDKRWLIRTRAKQILGPASLEKIISLLEKNSLKDEDELSSGNGYWFWVKEKELVDKYIYKGVKQDFNPISEAITVLSNSAEKLEKKTVSRPRAEDEPVIPSNEDLEFPDVESITGRPEAHREVQESTQSLVMEKPEIPLTVDKTKESIENPEKKVTEAPPAVHEEAEEVIEVDDGEAQEEDNIGKKGSYTSIIIFVVVLLLVCIIFYYKKILNKPLPLIGMSSVYAQTTDSLVKKKA